MAHTIQSPADGRDGQAPRGRQQGRSKRRKSTYPYWFFLPED